MKAAVRIYVVSKPLNFMKRFSVTLDLRRIYFVRTTYFLYSVECYFSTRVKGDQDENSKTHQNNNIHLRNGYTSYAPDSPVFGNLSVDSGRTEEGGQSNAAEPC